MLMNQQFYRQNQNPSTLVLVITNEEHMINEILYQPGLGLSNHVCLYFNHLCYVKKCNRPIPRFNCTVPILTSLIIYSIQLIGKKQMPQWVIEYKATFYKYLCCLHIYYTISYGCSLLVCYNSNTINKLSLLHDNLQ